MSALAPVSRGELLQRLQRIRLARQGRDVLHEKRRQLMAEMIRVANRMTVESDRLDQDLEQALGQLALANGVAGTQAVASAAIAARDHLEIDVRKRSLAGLHVMEIEYGDIDQTHQQRGRTPGSVHWRIDQAASRFEGVVERMLEVAETELLLRRLAAELQRTSRRVNALEFTVIPALEAQCRTISAGLQERERTETFRRMRLKHRKIKLKRKVEYFNLVDMQNIPY